MINPIYSYLIACYAQVLFELLYDENHIDDFSKDVSLFASMLKSDDTILKFFSSSAISIEEKAQVVYSLKNCINETLLEFILVVLQSHRANLLLDIFNVFFNLVKKHNKEVDIEIISSVPLTEKDVQDIGEALLPKYGKVVNVINTVDPKILGGFIVRVGFDVIDASLNSYLQKLLEASKMAIYSFN